MREAIQERAGQPFVAHHLRPLLKRQVGSHQQAGALVGPADNLEQQFRPRLGEGDVAQFVKHQEMRPLQLLVESLQGSLFASFQEPGHQSGHREEADMAPLLAGG